MKIFKRTVKFAAVMLAANLMLLVISAAVCGIRPYIVMSGSMEPEIETGSICFIDGRNRDVRIGDIVAYKTGDITVIHRVISETDDGYITKGDNNDAADAAPVPAENISGKYYLEIPKLGYIAAAVKQPVVSAENVLRKLKNI